MKKLLLASAIALAASSTAFADNTATGTLPVGGKVIAALGITKTTDAVMPDLVAPNGTEGKSSVTMGCNSSGTTTVGYTGNGSPFAGGNVTSTTGVDTNSDNKSLTGPDEVGTCGKMTVTGQADYKYAVTEATDDTASVTGLELKSVTCTSADFTMQSGTDDLYCGATVEAANTVTASATPYALNSSITVTYD